MAAEDTRIEPWKPDHPSWQDLQQLISDLGQYDWVSFQADWHIHSQIIVASEDARPVGFLRFVVQAIGPDADCSPLAISGEPLVEAKILAFGVLPDRRRRGIGRRLQIAAIESSRALGCYQVRSYSDGHHPENHRLKLALGFCAHPVMRPNGKEGVYFIFPLRPAAA